MSPSTKRPRRRLAPADRQREILDAVEQVLERHGFQGVTVPRIVAEAQVAQGSFYRYFRNRDHACAALVELALEPLQAALLALDFAGVDTAPELEAMLLQFYRVLAEVLLRHPRLVREALMVAPGTEGELGETMSAFVAQLRDIGVAFFREMAGRPPYRATRHPHIASNAVLGMVFGATLAAADSDHEFEPEAWAREMAALETALLVGGQLGGRES